MKKLIFMLASMLALFSCYDDTIIRSQMQEFEKRLEELTGTVIALVDDQVESIHLSIADLQNVDKELKNYIQELEAVAKTLEERIETAEGDISSIVNELSLVKAALEELRIKDAALEKALSDLKVYVDENLKSSKDWAESVFTTFAQYDSLQTELSSLKLVVEGLASEVEAIAAKMSEDLSSAISASESGMKLWVNEQLAEGYYDIAAIDAQLSSLATAYKDADAQLQTKIEAQQTALEQTKKDLTEEYKKAIEDAIENNNGVLDTKIANVVKTAQEALQKQIDDLQVFVDTMKARLDLLATDFVNRIQSLVFIPEYTDGKVAMYQGDGAFNVKFLVTPTRLASDLKALWQTDNKVIQATLYYAADPQTRSTDNSLELKVTSVETTSEGLLYLTVCEDSMNPVKEEFWEGKIGAFACIRITDGNNDKASDLITLEGKKGNAFPDHIELPIPGPGTPSGVTRTANCYIISEAGSYVIKTVKGNSSDPVGAVASAEVIWESFGTDELPEIGDLIASVSYSNGRIGFTTAETFREGNAVIAAKDASGNILWSWHIWMTDEPDEQVYYNGAGTMMDRNLGATSATPGDVGALGLLYQWGRKDPFLGSSSISSSVLAASTLEWPESVASDASTGTVEYATANPTTFILGNETYDWLMEHKSNLWQSDKSIFDPCPVGYRVPDGGNDGVWSTALNSSDLYTTTSDFSNHGIDFSQEFGSSATIWYPTSGYRYYQNGILSGVDGHGYGVNYSWSATAFDDQASYRMGFQLSLGDFEPAMSGARSYGFSVRCLKEGSRHSSSGGGSEDGSGGESGGSGAGESVDMDNAEDVSADLETANSYIVTKSGSYKFKAYKGNSKSLAGSPSSVDPVGEIAKVEVLWESFGTSETPAVGDLIKDVAYEYPYIGFKTADTFREGNAVIAVRDASDNILWSWHIWMTDYPQPQVYDNGAGTMMDRNLGATSATPGDVGALGLLYQWGRKDPFLGSSSINESIDAASTITWPRPVESDANTGTIGYSATNPTTYIIADRDWLYNQSDIRWDAEKTIYDPCPVGWRVPDGGDIDGVWTTASGKPSVEHSGFDAVNWGVNFSGVLGDSPLIWYPSAFARVSSSGTLCDWVDGSMGVRKDDTGRYWSCSYQCLDYTSVSKLRFESNNMFNPFETTLSSGYSVRCLKEGSRSNQNSTLSWFLVGDFNGWTAADPAYKMTKEGDWYVFKGFSSDGTGLKFVSDVNWSRSRGGTFVAVGEGVDLRTTDANIQMPSGTYDVYLSKDAIVAYFVTPDNGVRVHVDYVDEYGINHGNGVEIDGVVWAPVNCGYHSKDFQWGKVYQWGRKYGQGYSGDLYDIEGNNVGFISDAEVAVPVQGPVSLSEAQSADNADKFYTVSVSPWNWLDVNNVTLWNSGDGVNPVKAEYDPCPSGWRVPTISELAELGTNRSELTTNDVGQPGYWFSGETDYSESSPRIFLVAAGGGAYGTGALGSRGIWGDYWASDPLDGEFSAYLRCDESSIFTGRRANGYSVRCVQE